jgi:hypothetical protein
MFPARYEMKSYILITHVEKFKGLIIFQIIK